MVNNEYKKLVEAEKKAGIGFGMGVNHEYDYGDDVQEDDTDEAQDWNDNISADINYILPAHFGVVADIQRWILDTSRKKQPAIALGAALSVMSAVIGRNINCDGLKGNLLTICIAESGEGKDRPMKCAKHLLDSVGLGAHVHGQMASGAALVDALVDAPSSVMILDEIGHYLAGIKGSRSNPYAAEIMPMITEMYSCADSYYLEKKRKGTDARKIEEPNLSVLGMATERQIIDSVRTSEVADGSMARFFIMFGNNNVELNLKIDRTNIDPPEHIISALVAIRDESTPKGFDRDRIFKSVYLEPSEEYLRLKDKIELDFNQLGIKYGKEKGDKEAFKPFYFRVAARAVQMSILIDQCQSVEVLQWCANVCSGSVDVFIKKYLHLGSDNENERQYKLIERHIKEAGKNGIECWRLSDKTRQVTPQQRESIIKDMLENGKIFTDLQAVVLKSGKRSMRKTLFYYWRKR